MNVAYYLYNLIIFGLFIAVFPVFWLFSILTGRYFSGLKQRLGHFSNEVIESISGNPVIWIHAVSVGEVNVALTVIEQLNQMLPHCSIILSATTETGVKCAKDGSKQIKQNNLTCIYAPIDFWYSIRKSFVSLKPDVLVSLETELWPNWFVVAHRMGIKTALINGRISIRSIKGYRRIRMLLKNIFIHIDAFSMIHNRDALRIQSLGAPGQRIRINGNAKYDRMLQLYSRKKKLEMGNLFNLSPHEIVWVAGSTRGGEELIVLDIFQQILSKYPEATLIIAPRHVTRSSKIKKWVESRGLTCCYRSELDRNKRHLKPKVYIIDTIGELKHIYSLATLVFCGGSLIALGGQNILEPAVWMKPVFYGPSMQDFLDAKEMLETVNGSVPIGSANEFNQKMFYYLDHPNEADEMGKRALRALIANQGASKRHAQIIVDLLENG